MKKLILLLATLLNITAALAFDTNGNFGMTHQLTTEAYQQYVGKTFFVRQAFGRLETWKKSGFKFDQALTDKTFSITKITVKNVTLNDEPNKEITVQAVEVGGKKKIKFKGYEKVSAKVSIWSGVKLWPQIEYMPIVFTEPYNEFVSKHLGETITHDMVKDRYEVTNVYIGAASSKDAATAVHCVTVKNKRTGETVNCPYSDVKSTPFKKALEGSYKTALVCVEKPAQG